MTNPVSDEAINRLPKPIVDKLDLLIKRLRRMMWLRGGLAVAAVVLGALMTIMAIDAALVIFSTGVRWALSLVGLGVVAAAVYRFLYQPLRRRYTLTRIARVIEIRHPALQERISSSVELLSDAREREGVSQRMITELVKEAVQEIESVSPAEEFNKRAVVPYVTATGVASAILLALLAIWPAQTVRLLARAVAPYARIGNIYSVRMNITPGDIVIAQGEPLAIGVTLGDSRATRVELRRTAAGQNETVERMLREPTYEVQETARFEMQIPSVHTSFSYRVRSERALSAYYRVEAVPRPELAGLSLRQVFPEYTGLAPVVQTNAAGDITAPLGTRIEMNAVLNKPVTNAVLLVNGRPSANREHVADAAALRHGWALDLSADMSGSWSLRLGDKYGFTNKPQSYPLKVIPDKVPLLELLTPYERQLKLKPIDMVEINYLVSEDYGVARVDLLLATDGQDMSDHSQHVAARVEQRDGTWRGTILLDLAALDLSQAKTLRVRLRATDTLPPELGGPQDGESETIVITLSRTAASMAEQTLAAQAEEIAKTLESVEDRLEAAKQEGDKRAEQMKAAELDQATRDALEEMRRQIDVSEQAIQEMAERLQDSVFDKLADAMEQARAEDIAPALEAAEMLPLSDNAAERQNQAANLQENLAQALADMAALKKELEMRAEDLKALARMQDLAVQETALAQQLDQKLEADQNNLDAEWRAQQKQATAEFTELMAQQPASAAEQLRQQREQARALAQDARALAEEQNRMRQALDKAKGGQNNEQLQQDLMREMARRQQEIAGDTQQLQKEGSLLEQPSQAPLEQAQQAAQSAAAQLSENALTEARQSAQQAQQKLQETGRQLQQEQQNAAATEDAAADWRQHQQRGEMAETAGELAQRQQRLVEAMKAVEAGKLDQALAELQKDSSSRDTALSQEAAELRAEVQAMTDNATAAQAAAEAVRNMQTAAQQARNAAGAVPAALQPPPAAEPGQPAPADPSQPALQAQQVAQAEMNKAAKNLDGLGRILDQAIQEMTAQVPDQPLLNPAMMNEAYAEMQAAQEAGSVNAANPPAQAAAQSMQQMAQAMAERMAMTGPPGAPSSQPGLPRMRLNLPGPNTDGQGNYGPDMGGEIPKMLQGLGLSKADWLRMKGELRSDVAGSESDDIPEEYRALVRKYFEEVARRGAESDNEQ